MKYLLVLLTSIACTQAAANSIFINEITDSEYCGGTPTGAIDLEIDGGHAPFTFVWTGPDNFAAETEDINNLQPGEYTVTVTDQLCGVASLTVEVNCLKDCPEIELRGLKAAITNPTACETEDGVIYFRFGGPMGGQDPYDMTLYDEDGEEIPDTPFGWTNLPGGLYTLHIVDANGCEETFEIELVPDDGTPIYTSDVRPECIDQENGYIGILAFSQYEEMMVYHWESDQWEETQTITSDDVVEFFNLEAGTYCVTITTENGFGCPIDECFVVEELSESKPLEIEMVNYTERLCPEDPPIGYIEVFVAGGIADPETANPLWAYDFDWSSGSQFPPNRISNLAAGTYDLTVTDYCGSSITVSYTIDLNPEIIVTATPTNTCVNENMGAISLNVSGGTPPFSYEWSNGNNASELSNLFAGEYCVWVTDAAGCEKKHCTEVKNFPELRANLAVIDDCGEPYTRGSMAVNITGGDAPFTFNWNTGSNTQSINNLDIGNYAVTITDAYGCTLELSASVEDGLVVFNSTDPCAIITRCNGAEVDFEPFDEDCGYYDPFNCRMWECYCTLTNELMFDPVEHFYEEEYFDNEFCEYVGVCPDDVFDDAPWWGEEVIESGVTVVKTLPELVDENDCPDNTTCVVCFKKEYCDYPNQGLIHDSDVHFSEPSSVTPQYITGSSIQEDYDNCGGLCSAVYKCGINGEEIRLCIGDDQPCPTGLTNDDGSSGLLSAEFPDLLNGFLVVYTDKSELEIFNDLVAHFSERKQMSVLEIQLDKVVNDQVIDLRIWKNELSSLGAFLFPNPTHGNLTVHIAFSSNQQLYFSLVDVSGKTTEVVPENYANDTYELDLRKYNISAGVYTLNIISDDGLNISKRFVYQP